MKPCVKPTGTCFLAVTSIVYFFPFSLENDTVSAIVSFLRCNMLFLSYLAKGTTDFLTFQLDIYSSVDQLKKYCLISQ